MRACVPCRILRRIRRARPPDFDLRSFVAGISSCALRSSGGAPGAASAALVSEKRCFYPGSRGAVAKTALTNIDSSAPGLAGPPRPPVRAPPRVRLEIRRGTSHATSSDDGVDLGASLRSRRYSLVAAAQPATPRAGQGAASAASLRAGRGRFGERRARRRDARPPRLRPTARAGGERRHDRTSRRSNGDERRDVRGAPARPRAARRRAEGPDPAQPHASRAPQRHDRRRRRRRLARRGRVRERDVERVRAHARALRHRRPGPVQPAGRHRARSPIRRTSPSTAGRCRPGTTPSRWPSRSRATATASSRTCAATSSRSSRATPSPPSKARRSRSRPRRSRREA